MNTLVLIGLGGCLGAILRYELTNLLSHLSISFPIGTLGINVIGSFCLGLIMFSTEQVGWIDEKTLMFFAIGLLGSFTTMSTFSYESFQLIHQGKNLLFLINITATVFFTLSAIILGKFVVMNIIK